MDAMQILFLIFAAITLGAALNVVSARNLVHSALWLVLALFGVAAVYVLLNAGFFAVAQVLIYIGAIAILFIFVVMLTRGIMKDGTPQTNANWWLPLLVAVAFFVGMFWMVTQWSGAGVYATDLPKESEQIAELGLALVGKFLLPFELASVLLVAAMIGAIYVAWGKKYAPESRED